MENILDTIRLGEDTSLELKRVIFRGKRIEAPDKKDIADEISAMANAFGGRIVFGVDDQTREPLPMSVTELDLLETWLRELCADMVEPQLVCNIRKIAVGDNLGIIAVDVPRSVFVHKGAHGYFTRIGSSKRELTPDALARLFQQKSQSRIVCFDEQIVAQTTPDTLSPELYKRFRTDISDNDNTAFLKKLHFLGTDQDGALRATVAGILMASRQPETFFPSAYIQAVAYRGKTRTAAEQLDARDIYGPLDEQITEAVRFVNRNMRVFAIKAPGRVDIPQFPLAAVFEAVVNAVAHRDYSISGAKIRLHVFSDRIEIFSPGGLPNEMSIDEIVERQFARNELLCSVISRCKITESVQNIKRMTMMDRRGEGVPIILKEGEKIADKRPVYEVIDNAEVKLTIFAAPGDSVHELYKIARKLYNDTPDRESRLIQLLRENPSVTQNTLATILAVSRSWVAQHIAKLKADGIIRRNGSDRTGEWTVADI